MFIPRFILVMVLASQPVYASQSAAPLALFLLGIIGALALLGIIFFILIIASTVFLIQRRSTPARRKYGKTAEMISYILILPFPVFIMVMSIVDGSLWDNITQILTISAMVAIPGLLSAFLAHKVELLPAER
jgi:Ca2+/Na+ antiporter